MALLFGLPISMVTQDELLSAVEESIAQNQSSYYCFASTHSLVEAVLSPGHCRSLRGAVGILPDGMPIVQFLRLVRGLRLHRLSGLDVLFPLLARCQEKGYRVAIVGGNDTLYEALLPLLNSDFPQLSVFAHPLPYASVEELASEHLLRELKDYAPDVVVVGLGCPKQEAWMKEVSGQLNAVFLGVGYALTVYAGQLSRAPLWMRQMSLEWLYRLAQEPGRLWWRYLKYNSLFIVFALLDTAGWRFKLSGGPRSNEF